MAQLASAYSIAIPKALTAAYYAAVALMQAPVGSDTASLTGKMLTTSVVDIASAHTYFLGIIITAQGLSPYQLSGPIAVAHKVFQAEMYARAPWLQRSVRCC